uniref:Uncharacterized protein n=1 Tax=Staphylothermus marinus TaxID=2280 RepID=A0A7C4D826_STAMA
MYSRLFSIGISMIFRGLFLSVLFTITILFFYGYLPYINRDVFTYLSITTGIIDEQSVLFFKIIIPIALLFLLPVYIKTRELYIGLIKFITVYSSICLIILILSYSHIVYYKYVRSIDFVNELYYVSFSLILLLFNIVLAFTYPLIAISIVRVDRVGRIKSVDTSVNEIQLDPGEVVRIKIYGDQSSIGIRSQPENSIKVIGFNKTFFYKYIDIYPLSSFGGYVELFYKDKLLYRFKCIYKSIEYRRIKFNVFFNDDYIYSHEVSVESYKSVLESIESLIDSITGKLGIDKSDISRIVFYTIDKIHIPGDTIISDLTNVNEVNVMIYSTEKYMEIYKYYSKSDIYNLWETLVKRLEILRREISDLINETEELIGRVKYFQSNWW